MTHTTTLTISGNPLWLSQCYILSNHQYLTQAPICISVNTAKLTRARGRIFFTFSEPARASSYRLHMRFFCTMVQISFITYPSKINGSLHKITHNATIGCRHLQSWPMPLIGSAPLSHVHFLPGNSLDWLKMSTDWLRFFSLNQHLFPSRYTKRRSFIEAEQPTIMSPPHMASGECIMFWAPYRAYNNVDQTIMSPNEWWSCYSTLTQCEFSVKIFLFSALCGRAN